MSKIVNLSVYLGISLSQRSQIETIFSSYIIDLSCHRFEHTDFLQKMLLRLLNYIILRTSEGLDLAINNQKIFATKKTSKVRCKQEASIINVVSFSRLFNPLLQIITPFLQLFFIKCSLIWQF